MSLFRKKQAAEPTIERDVLRAALAMRQAARGAHQKAQKALDDADEYLATLEAERDAQEAAIEAATASRVEAMADAIKLGRNPNVIEAVTDDRTADAEKQRAMAQRAHAGLSDEADAALSVVRTAETKTRLAIAGVLRQESAAIAKQFIEADELARRLRTQLVGLRALGDSFLGAQSIEFEANAALHRTADRYPDRRGIAEAAQAWRSHAERLEADINDSFSG